MWASAVHGPSRWQGSTSVRWGQSVLMTGLPGSVAAALNLQLASMWLSEMVQLAGSRGRQFHARAAQPAAPEPWSEPWSER